MLNIDDLLNLKNVPKINDISLQLYKDFSEKYLIGKIFHYEFTDNTSLDIEFTEWGIYHMLGIQHIDGKIKKSTFFEQIENGLSFEYFEEDNGKKCRFRDLKRRIAMFACVYTTLKNGKVFYLAGKHIKDTAKVDADYIIYEKLINNSPIGITNNGLNIAIRKMENKYVPISILVSTNSSPEEYIKKRKKR